MLLPFNRAQFFYRMPGIVMCLEQKHLLVWMLFMLHTAGQHIDVYRKRPCISRTFFHKIEAQNQGCGLSMDTSVFGVLKHPN